MTPIIIFHEGLSSIVKINLGFLLFSVLQASNDFEDSSGQILVFEIQNSICSFSKNTFFFPPEITNQFSHFLTNLSYISPQTVSMSISKTFLIVYFFNNDNNIYSKLILIIMKYLHNTVYIILKLYFSLVKPIYLYIFIQLHFIC